MIYVAYGAVNGGSIWCFNLQCDSGDTVLRMMYIDHYDNLWCISTVYGAARYGYV